MRRPPRPASSHLLSPAIVAWSLLQGFLWILLALVGSILVIALTWPPAEALFRFGPFHVHDLAMSLAAGVAVLLAMEAVKPLWRISFRS